MERLQKVLAHAGVASRRAAERLIVEGRVTVNGRLVTELGTRVDAERDAIKVDGKRLRGVPHVRTYLVLHKPRGYVTTLSDPEGRPTVRDLIKGVKVRIYPVGRLDFHSEGLLLLTDDGELARPHHARGQERQLVADPVDDQRVAGIVTALETHDDIGALGQPVDDLAFSLVTPLRPDDNYVGHDNPLD